MAELRLGLARGVRIQDEAELVPTDRRSFLAVPLSPAAGLIWVRNFSYRSRPYADTPIRRHADTFLSPQTPKFLSSGNNTHVRHSRDGRGHTRSFRKPYGSQAILPNRYAVFLNDAS